jgi:hypothetical protein
MARGGDDDESTHAIHKALDLGTTGGAGDRAAAAGVVEVLEALVAEGKVRFYGRWAC